MSLLFRKGKGRTRGGQIMGVLLAVVVIVGMIALYMPIFYQ